MKLLRRTGQAALAWVFLRSGYDVVRNPGKPAVTAAPFLGTVRRALPVALPDDTTLVRANAALQIAAGGLLAAGVTPRAAALALIGSLVPTTLAGHAFWKLDDEALRPNQRNHFNKNVAVLGGLLVLLSEERNARDPG